MNSSFQKYRAKIRPHPAAIPVHSPQTAKERDNAGDGDIGEKSGKWIAGSNRRGRLNMGYGSSCGGILAHVYDGNISMM